MQGDWTVVPEKTADHWLEVRGEDGFREASVKWDGCVHYTRHYNQPGGDGDSDYIHICDLAEEIQRLESLLAIARAHFGEDWAK